MLVPILLGSESDRDFAKKIIDELDKFGVSHEIKVVSAHKVPELCVELVHKYNKEKNICYITVVGRSNGLSGMIAGSSIHPVIACPPFSDKADYLVNVHSSLQMPSDTPVLTVIDPKNAALCAVRILALTSPELRKKVEKRILEVKASFQ